MKAKSLGIQAQDYETDKVTNLEELYKELVTIENLDNELVSKLYEEQKGIPFEEMNLQREPYAHEYFILKSDKSSVLAHYDPV